MTPCAEAVDYYAVEAAYKKDDYTNAIILLRPPAEQGDVGAQYNLAVMYSLRHHQNDNKRKWYHPTFLSMYDQVRKLIQWFKGVPEDKVLAYMWWNLAAASGSEKASKNKDIIAERMTSSQIEKAQELSRECFKKNYKDC